MSSLLIYRWNGLHESWYARNALASSMDAERSVSLWGISHIILKWDADVEGLFWPSLLLKRLNCCSDIKAVKTSFSLKHSPFNPLLPIPVPPLFCPLTFLWVTWTSCSFKVVVANWLQWAVWHFYLWSGDTAPNLMKTSLNGFFKQPLISLLEGVHSKAKAQCVSCRSEK